ncbi:2-nonaprenyl-3-methyl-6-methoxy-1,4-benzoquinol hydroxylase [Allostella sp. ATCC 35155]|nr:2-nonaprenyl-3-methyl-6-methoxy-1,4-benzoquinol hydroxylase [Stella sp. ATCC 35155]
MTDRSPPRTAPALGWRLPGDPAAPEQLARMIRVDHAGEYGARRIYEGQLAVLGRGPSGPAIRHMAEQESRHLESFERLIVERRVRPTALLPVWHLAGYALGAATALLGEKAAMACTVAVEEVIDEHYRGQSEALGTSEPEIRAQVEEFRAEELEHRDTALLAGAAEAPAYPVLSAAIKAASRLAIRLSQRI